MIFIIDLWSTYGNVGRKSALNFIVIKNHKVRWMLRILRKITFDSIFLINVFDVGAISSWKSHKGIITNVTKALKIGYIDGKS